MTSYRHNNCRPQSRYPSAIYHAALVLSAIHRADNLSARRRLSPLRECSSKVIAQTETKARRTLSPLRECSSKVIAPHSLYVLQNPPLSARHQQRIADTTRHRKYRDSEENQEAKFISSIGTQSHGSRKSTGTPSFARRVTLSSLLFSPHFAIEREDHAAGNVVRLNPNTLNFRRGDA
jgi:hypothetical protein